MYFCDLHNTKVAQTCTITLLVMFSQTIEFKGAHLDAKYFAPTTPLFPTKY